MAVWGRSYTNLFLELSLPSQLAPGNIPALSGLYNVVYFIFTTTADSVTIRQHSAYAKLTEYVSVEFICDDASIAADKFAPLIAFHNRSILHAAECHAALLFLAPDFVLADGGMRRIAELHAQGKRVIFTLTPRMLREQSHDVLRAPFDETTQAIALPAQTLAGLSFQYLHLTEKSYFWGDRYSSFPIHAYWWSGDDGIIAHCFYLHPIFVAPEIPGVTPVLTIDADFVDRCCPTREAVHVVQDSDDFYCVELSSEGMGDANATGDPWAASVWRYARWARVHANPVYHSTLHHWLFLHQICLHKGGRESLSKEVMSRARGVACAVSLLIWLGRSGRWLKENLSVLALLHFTVRRCVWRLQQALGREGTVPRWPPEPPQSMFASPPAALRKAVRALHRVPGCALPLDGLRKWLMLALPLVPCQAMACFAYAERLRGSNSSISTGPLYATAVLGIDPGQFHRVCKPACEVLITGWDVARLEKEAIRWAGLATRHPKSIGAHYFYALLLLHTGRRREGLRVMASQVRLQVSPGEKACWIFAHFCLVRDGKESGDGLVGLRRILAYMEQNGVGVDS